MTIVLPQLQPHAAPTLRSHPNPSRQDPSPPTPSISHYQTNPPNPGSQSKNRNQHSPSRPIRQTNPPKPTRPSPCCHPTRCDQTRPNATSPQNANFHAPHLNTPNRPSNAGAPKRAAKACAPAQNEPTPSPHRGAANHPPPLPTISSCGWVIRMGSRVLESSSSGRSFFSRAISRTVLPVLKLSLAISAALS